MANKTSLQIIPVCIDHDIQPGESITGLILSSSKSSINDGDIKEDIIRHPELSEVFIGDATIKDAIENA